MPWTFDDEAIEQIFDAAGPRGDKVLGLMKSLNSTPPAQTPEPPEQTPEDVYDPAAIADDLANSASTGATSENSDNSESTDDPDTTE